MKSNHDICFCGYTVIVPDERAEEAHQIWNDLEEYESDFVCRQAFRDAGFEVRYDRETL